MSRIIIIIFVTVFIASVLPNRYQQKNKMLIDFDYLVSQLYVQHCTFVEIGEGVCSLFIELTLDLGSTCKKPTSRQMFFGNCLCSEFRGWQLCSHQLTLQRPDDCVFEEGVDCPSSSARVHRRLCDITGMSQWNTQCNCSVSLAGMQQEPLCGFRTCFADPMPASICTPRTVCGTARCDISLHGSLYAVKCDRRCKDHQSFCQQTGPATSEKRIVTSEWTGWQSLTNEDTKASIQQFEAECLNTEGKPAFDCIGPGLLCCGLEEVDCICEVKQEDGHLKVYRYTITLLSSKESEHLSLRVRSINLKGQAKVWNRLLDVASKEDESDSLFSSQKLKDMRSKDKLGLESFGIKKFEPKGNQMNLYTTSILYENISLLLKSTVPPNTQTIATVASNSDLKHNVHSFFNQLSELSTPFSIKEKQNKIHNSKNFLVNLQHPGRHKNVSLEMVRDSKVKLPSDAIKSNALDSDTKIQSSIDNTETHEQTKEEISQYHFTINPNAESKILATTGNTENATKGKNIKNFNDHITEGKESFINQTQEAIKDGGKNNDNEEENIFLNKENKNIVVESKKSIEQTLEMSKNHKEDLNLETNEEIYNNIDQEIDGQANTNTLHDDKEHLKSINTENKDSLTDSKMPTEQNFFQNEMDYNAKNSESNSKMITNEILKNQSVGVNSSTSNAKPNIQNDKYMKDFIHNNVNDDKKGTKLESSNESKYGTRTEKFLTSPVVVSEFTSGTTKNNFTSSETEDKNKNEHNVSDERNATKQNNGFSDSTENKTPKKKEKYGNVQGEECVSISETKISVTNKTNTQNNNNFNNINLHSNNTKTKENNITNTAKGSSVTKIPFGESKIATVVNGDSTTPCITIKLDNQPKSTVTNFSSKENSTTDLPTVTKVSSISRPNVLNITNKQEAHISQIQSIKASPSKTIKKLTKSKENILMDQKEALHTSVSNLNPPLGLEEDGPNSQNSLYDEPEPVLKDLDKDDVDDNMADVLNNMIGMKHHHDKLVWTQKKEKENMVPLKTKKDKDVELKNINSEPSKDFVSHDEDLETNEQTIKTKKTKKKVH